MLFSFIFIFKLHTSTFNVRRIEIYLLKCFVSHFFCLVISHMCNILIKFCCCCFVFRMQTVTNQFNPIIYSFLFYSFWFKICFWALDAATWKMNNNNNVWVVCTFHCSRFYKITIDECFHGINDESKIKLW